MFYHCTCETDVLILYIRLHRRLSEDSSLSLSKAEGLMYMDNLEFRTIYVHNLVRVNGYKMIQGMKSVKLIQRV